MTGHLQAICPLCGEPVEEAGDLCEGCASDELEGICPECHDPECDGDCYDEYDEADGDDEIEDHVVNSRGDIA